MAVHGICRKPNELDASLSEFRFKLRKGAEFRRAHWSVIFGVREENNPFVANEPEQR